MSSPPPRSSQLPSSPPGSIRTRRTRRPPGWLGDYEEGWRGTLGDHIAGQVSVRISPNQKKRQTKKSKADCQVGGSQGVREQEDTRGLVKQVLVSPSPRGKDHSSGDNDAGGAGEEEAVVEGNQDQFQTGKVQQTQEQFLSNLAAAPRQEQKGLLGRVESRI